MTIQELTIAIDQIIVSAQDPDIILLNTQIAEAQAELQQKNEYREQMLALLKKGVVGSDEFKTAIQDAGQACLHKIILEDARRRYALHLVYNR